MKKFPILLAAAALATTNAAHALTLDLTDGVFTTVTPSIIPGDPVVFSDTAGGVTFTFTATNNLVGVNRFISGLGDNFSNGIVFGGGGGSTISFDFTVDTEIEVTGYRGFDQTFLTGVNATLREGATTLDSGVAFNSDGNSAADAALEAFAGGASFLLSAGTVYSVDVNNASPVTQSFLTGIEFDLINSPPAVPLPAGLPLLLAGLGSFAWLRRKARA